MVKLLQQSKLIVCKMQDLRNNQNQFGGVMILLPGDFRQTMPLNPRSTPTEQLN